MHVTLGGGLNFVLLKFLIHQSKITGKIFILDNKQLAHEPVSQTFVLKVKFGSCYNFFILLIPLNVLVMCTRSIDEYVNDPFQERVK